jgi:hypothetical protein
MELAEGINQEEAEVQWEEQEEQNLEDIRLGLLATLAEYRGYPHIKKLFEEAIRSVSAYVL